MVGVTTNPGNHHRQTGHQRFEQNYPRRLAARGMHQYIRRQHQIGNILAAAEKGHLLLHLLAPGQQAEAARAILARHQQAKPARGIRSPQIGKAANRPVQALGDKTGTHQQQGMHIVSKAQLVTGAGATGDSVRRAPPIRRHAGRQQVHARRRRVVVALELALFAGGYKQDFCAGGGIEHRPFPGGKVTEAPAQAVKQSPAPQRLVEKTGICSVIDIQPRHLVKADHAIHRCRRQLRLRPLEKVLVAPHIAAGKTGRQPQFDPRQVLALPASAVHPAVVATLLQQNDKPREITLQPAVGKILVEQKSQAHLKLLPPGPLATTARPLAA